MTRALLPVALLLAMLLGSAAPASAQAATSNCPPGQPFGRPPGTPPADPGRPNGRPPNYPPGRCQLALSQSSAARGETFVATGEGFVPGESVVLSLGSTRLTSVVADANGRFSAELTVPDDAPFGATQVRATGANQELTAAFEVVAAPSSQSAAQRQAAPAASRGGLLSRTGADTIASVALALLLIAVGSVAVVASRRRATA